MAYILSVLPTLAIGVEAHATLRLSGVVSSRSTLKRCKVEEVDRDP
jgi:hypothetical protein